MEGPLLGLLISFHSDILILRSEEHTSDKMSISEWNEMSNPNKGPSIDFTYQVSGHFAKRFQRRRLKCEKLTNTR
jgi:hypothetical protein